MFVVAALKIAIIARATIVSVISIVAIVSIVARAASVASRIALIADASSIGGDRRAFVLGQFNLPDGQPLAEWEIELAE
ncbi:MAG: hypothetical protein ACKOQX_06380, partial [Actinomycetota bacterium]